MSQSSILELVDTITLLASTTKFVAKKKFVVSVSPKAEVKISGFWGDFEERFLDTVEEPMPATTLRVHKLRKDSLDTPIVAELGGEEKAAITLQEIFSLLEQQGHGQTGPLLTNGRANIFYVLDKRDKGEPLRAVFVCWYGVGWYVSAYSVLFPDVWYGGDQVFSRNFVL